MLSKLGEFIDKDAIRDIVFIVISGVALVASFFNISIFGLNAAWISIVLCGIPIIKEAILNYTTSPAAFQGFSHTRGKGCAPFGWGNGAPLLDKFQAAQYNSTDSRIKQ